MLAKAPASGNGRSIRVANVERTPGRGERLLESAKLRQGRSDPVEAELGEAELGRASRDVRGRTGSVGLRRRLEERDGVPILAQAPVDLAEPEIRFHDEPAVGQPLGQREGPPPGRERPRQIPRDPGVVADVGRDLSEPPSVLERLGEALGLVQVVA